MTRFVQVLAILLLLTGCVPLKHEGSKGNERPSILDHLLLPSAVVTRVKAAECDLPTDKWETLPQIGDCTNGSWICGTGRRWTIAGGKRELPVFTVQ
jgi:hypothetical protein